MEGRRQIDGEDCVPFFRWEVLQWGHMLDARIVDENVEPAGRLQGFFDHLADCYGLRHVRRGERHPHLEVRDNLRLYIGDLFRLAETVKDDFRAGCRQSTDNAQADPTRRPRNKRHLARKCLLTIDIFWLDGDVHGAMPPGWGGDPPLLFGSNLPDQGNARPMPIGYWVDRLLLWKGVSELYGSFFQQWRGRLQLWKCIRSDISWRSHRN